MRRFLCTPSDPSFEATGCVLPKPLAEMMFGLTHCGSRYATTLSARRENSAMLLVMPARCQPGPPACCRYGHTRRLLHSAGVAVAGRAVATLSICAEAASAGASTTERPDTAAVAVIGPVASQA